jgi:hypothetical protein
MATTHKSNSTSINKVAEKLTDAIIKTINQQTQNTNTMATTAQKTAKRTNNTMVKQDLADTLHAVKDANKDALIKNIDNALQSDAKPVSFLDSIQFADIQTVAVTRSKPVAYMRLNGFLVLSQPASDLVKDFIKGDLKDTAFRIGKDATGNVYFIPADKDTANAVHFIKNKDAVAIRNQRLFDALAIPYKAKFSFVQDTADNITYFKMIPLLNDNSDIDTDAK